MDVTGFSNRLRAVCARLATIALLPTVLILATQVGCHMPGLAPSPLPVAGPVLSSDMPRELRKVVLPDYVVEPPDILVIEAINVIPKAPYGLKVADVLSVRVASTLPEAPIDGPYPIGPGGGVDLGFPYGVVPLVELSLDQAKEAIV